MTTHTPGVARAGAAADPSAAFWGTVGELIDAYPDRPAEFSGQNEVNRLAARLKAELEVLAEHLVPHPEGWLTDASVGKGLYSNVPWAAVFDGRVTDRASRGFYPVVHLLSGGVAAGADWSRVGQERTRFQPRAPA